MKPSFLTDYVSFSKLSNNEVLSIMLLPQGPDEAFTLGWKSGIGSTVC